MTALAGLLMMVECPTADYTQARDRAELMSQSSFFRVYRNALRQSVGSESLRFLGSGYRVYFWEHGNDIVVLLCGGDKSAQSKDIQEAKTYPD